MNCRDVRELSSEYLDQRLLPAATSLLEEHLKVCPNCLTEVETLRTTIGQIASLDRIETSPDFLLHVQRTIALRDAQGAEPGRTTRGFLARGASREGILRHLGTAPFLGRLRKWAFHRTLNVPLKVVALVLFSIGVVHLYYRSPELSKRDTTDAFPKVPMYDARPLIPREGVTREDSQALRDRPKERAVERTAKSEGKDQVRDESGARSDTEPTVGKVLQQSAQQAAPAAPPPQIHEIAVENVAVYEKKVKGLLEEVGGKILAEDRSSARGLSLTFQVPQSRQAQFLSALQGQSSPKAEAEESRRTSALAQREVREKKIDETPSGERQALTSEPPLQKNEPTVMLQLRIVPKQ